MTPIYTQPGPRSCSAVGCSAEFEITQEDLDFYEKISPVFNGKKELIPPPTLCPECRRQRRHAHRNERNLYHRKCDLTGQSIISAYAPQRKVVVYNHHDWWGDTWSAHSYGKEFDFSRPFFEQFAEFLSVVPHMNVAVGNVINSDYCHLIADCKNCYLVFESSHGEDCLYGYWLQKCTDCCDISFSHACEQCYEIDNCYDCYKLQWSRNCTNCSQSAFLLDCIGCKNCLFCVNLRQKEYCIFNEQYTKDEYEKKKEALHLSSRLHVEEAKKEFDKFSLMHPRKYMTSLKEEACTGNYIQESKNCLACFHAHDAEDCKYAEHVWRGAKDCMDVVTSGRGAELIYESTNTGIGVMQNAFCIQSWSSHDMYYCSSCHSSHHCFGCVNMKNAQYCIFNKQYTKEEYEELVPKIIEHMRATPLRLPDGSYAGQEWGEFFSASISPFTYKESAAQEFFPLTDDVILARGWHWENEERARDQYLGPSVDIPDDIKNVSDDISKQILLCEVTGDPYKVIPQELKLYRELEVPVPTKSPLQRHLERMRLRNPMRLWNRTCAKCSKGIQTTYAPERPEIVYCESCYLETVY